MKRLRIVIKKHKNYFWTVSHNDSQLKKLQGVLSAPKSTFSSCDACPCAFSGLYTVLVEHSSIPSCKGDMCITMQLNFLVRDDGRGPLELNKKCTHGIQRLFWQQYLIGHMLSANECKHLIYVLQHQWSFGAWFGKDSKSKIAYYHKVCPFGSSQ